MRLWAASQPVANKNDVPAESIKLIRERGWDFHFVDCFLDVIKLAEQFFPLLGCRGLETFPFEHQQRTVRPVYP